MAFTDDQDLLDLIDLAVTDQKKADRLLQRTPDLLRRRNRLKETALHFLAIENYPAGVEYLCGKGAEIDPRDSSGGTPLLHAATLGNERIVEILLNHKADPGVADESGDSVLDCARRSGNARVVSMIAEALSRVRTPV